MTFVVTTSPPLLDGLPATFPECNAVHALLRASSSNVSYTTQWTTQYHPTIRNNDQNYTVTGLEAFVRSYCGTPPLSGLDGSVLSTFCSNVIPVISLALLNAQREAVLESRLRCSYWQQFRYSLRQVQADIAWGRFPDYTDATLVPKFASDMEVLEVVAHTQNLSPTLRIILRAALSLVTLALPVPYQEVLKACPTLSYICRQDWGSLSLLERPLYATAEAPKADMYSPGRTRAVVIGSMLLLGYWLFLNVSFTFEDGGNPAEEAVLEAVEAKEPPKEVSEQQPEAVKAAEKASH